jgi:tyrosinase
MVSHSSYWDELEDMKLDDLTQSAVFHPETGFGGDGVAKNRGCIQDGPFVNVTVSIGPNYRNVPTCLARSVNRRINPLQKLNATLQSTLCMDYTSYEDLWPCLYGTPHLLGHAIMGSLVRTPRLHLHKLVKIKSTD